jgi:outer membrane protein OmpA-like peptidoglycan-associated protein
MALALPVGGLALAACSSTPPPSATLTQARQAYATASSDPQVARYGSIHLEDAQDSLAMGEEAWKNAEPKPIVDHYAYMAQVQAATAGEVAKIRIAAIQASNAARVVTLPEMLFQTGKADLNEMGSQPIQDLATFLKNNPNRTATISGYTDSTGSLKTNQKLSLDRAQAVQDALVAQGVERSRITVQGLGPASPVATNATADGRQKNRRVEVAFTPGTETSGMGSSGGAR